MARDLSRLLRPASLAVFGGRWAESVLQQCQLIGFKGELWPVHPTRYEISGLRCYKSANDLPGPPDASFIGVNRFQTVEIVETLADMDAGGAICFAAGFREAMAEDPAAADLQEQLLTAAGAMPILGPNCYGLMNYLDRTAIWPDQHGGLPVTRGVAIITQSSNIALSLSMQRRGLPIAYLVTAGNQAQSGLADIALNVLEDPRVTALGLYIEGIGDIRAFEAMAFRARDLGKPIIALKAGKSAQASDIAITHTASLVGQDAGAEALLARLGIYRVHGLGGFLESLKLLHFQGGLGSGRLGSLSCSGGEANLIADAAQGRVLTFPILNEETKAALKHCLGPLVHLTNPLDYNTFIWGDGPALQATFAAMLGAGNDLTILILDVPRKDRCDPSAWRPTLEAFIAAKQETGAATAVIVTLPENLSEDWAGELQQAGITPLMAIEDGLTAIEAAVSWGANKWTQPQPLLLSGSVSGNTSTLDEAAAKLVLRQYGVPVPQSRRFEIAPEAAGAAEIVGFPVVVKSLASAHKSDAGLVRINLRSADEAAVAAAEMPGGAGGYLVEAHIEGAVAELLIGVRRDPAHGFLLTLGAGGVFTELLQDSVSLLLPVDREEIACALEELRIWPVLQGYRSKPGADLAAILDTVAAISNYVTDKATVLQELEINPYLALVEGGYAVDALIRIAEE